MPTAPQAACQREFRGNLAIHERVGGGPGQIPLAWARGGPAPHVRAGENAELSGCGHLLATQASSAGTRPQVIQPIGWPPGASAAESVVQVMPSVER